MPVVNYGLIGLNVLIFAAMSVVDVATAERIREPLMIWPGQPRVFQFVTYQFLHGDIYHLGGNMLFLWVFGNSVNSKMGNAVYAMFYLACGVFAGIGFLLTGHDNPCLGASGAIAAVTTAYLVLYPRSEVMVLYWLFIYVGVASINATWLIIGKMILWDNFIAMRIQGGGVTNVAYSAHIVGYIFGFTLSLLMLRLRALPRDQFDLLAVWRRAYQRRVFAAALSSPEAESRARYGRVAQVDGAAAPLARPADPTQPIIDQISAARSAGDFDGALSAYESLLRLDPTVALPQVLQLDIANQLAARERYAPAADAYERYLREGANTGDADQVRLLLGILYARHLNQNEPARRHLTDCLHRLSNSQQTEQAKHWLHEVTTRLAPPLAAPAGPSPD